MLALLRAPDAELLPRLSELLAGSVPHAGVAVLVRGEVRAWGKELADGGAEPTVADLTALARDVTPGSTRYGPVVLGGTARQALAVLPADPAVAGCVLVVVDPADSDEGRAVAQALGEIALVRLTMLVQPGPADLTHLLTRRIAAGEHAKDMLILKDEHSATLTAVLGALRSRRFDDATAREAAVSIASSALTAARTDSVAGERTAGEAFDVIAQRLRGLARHNGFRLELARPRHADRLLPPAVVEGGIAVVRGCVLVMLEHTRLSRIRIAWEVEDGRLVVSVRDDGDGELFPEALAEYRLRERLVALGGDFAIEAVPGWGTSVTARFPLTPAPSPRPDLLEGLSRRELEVLTELARGHSNRGIAARLHITEHTAKFHVANILSKLGVRTRGEAAAAARAAHL
ncbi:LuxR C-terminal-related transcriptional regulator [Streptomyces sp. NPDC004539]|uniref:LuxR C-terminal-related transcriptional regulator n=1 Tax=Streptomyces sp. NPDC004539 TaxID=3154280 RepID=UPI0033B8FBAD